MINVLKHQVLQVWSNPVNSDDEREDDEDDESDEDEMEEWLDYKDINSFSDGGAQIKSRALKRTAVTFKEYGSQEVFTVYGSFPMIDPWWAAELKVTKQRNKRRSLVGTPSYSVRSDDEVGRDRIVSILLAKSGVHEDHMKVFFEYVQNKKLEDILTFHNLPDIVAEFGLISEENADITESINKAIDNGPGKDIYQCMDHEKFYKYMPQLYPKRFWSIVKALDEKKISILERALFDQPWVFGYSNVMASMFHLYSCESSLKHYIDSELFEKLTPLHKDALRVYDDLKSQCYKDGHTFVYEEKLPTRPTLKDPQIYNWGNAFKFLESQKIIVLEVDVIMQQRRIYLKKLWSCEKSIAEGFQQLLNRHKHNPWEFDINFESSQFEDFRNDPDQKRAVELIAQQPLVCLSGKGGCGKTHVVSGVCQYAEELLETDAQKRYQEDLFNESDVLDDLTLTQSVSDFERTYLPSQSQMFNRKESDDILNNEDHTSSYPNISCGSKRQRDEFDDLFNDVFNKGDISSQEDKLIEENGLANGHCKTQNLEGSVLGDITSEIVVSQVDRSKQIGGTRFIQDDNKKETGKGKITEKEFPTVLLTAPTGKAANLLGKRAHLPSNTLHQVIFNYRYWKKKQFSDETKCDWKYSKVQALVVDECSLVSVSTFSTMFSMLLEEGNLKKVVLLGDINQLPSIEPGNFLTDVYRGLSAIGLSTLLRTNHRSEAQLIVDNATRISKKQIPEFDSDRNFHQCIVEEAMNGINPDTTLDDISWDRDRIVRHLLKQEALKDHRQSQFVAFRRNDCEAINEICCKHYAKHLTKTSKKKRDFQVGDKICSTKNADVPDSISSKNIRICNGEIFFIKQDITEQDGKKTRRYLVLGDDLDAEENDIKVDFHILRRSCKIRHAWARTIHTYQGSESETVVYVVGSPVLQTWQHVYTAVTRGKKKVFIITRSSHLQTAVRNEPRKRNSSLRDRLKKMIQRIPKDIFPMTPNRSVIINSPLPLSQNVQKDFILEKSKLAKRQLSYDFASTSKNKSKDTSHFDITNNQSSTCINKDKTDCYTAVNSQNNSQTFSDWGDELDAHMLEDLVELDSGQDINNSPVKENIHRSNQSNSLFDVSKSDCDPENPLCSCVQQVGSKIETGKILAPTCVNKQGSSLNALNSVVNKQSMSTVTSLHNNVHPQSVQQRNSVSSATVSNNFHQKRVQIGNSSHQKSSSSLNNKVMPSVPDSCNINQGIKGGNLLLSPKRQGSADLYEAGSPRKKIVLNSDMSPLRKQFDSASLTSPPGNSGN